MEERNFDLASFKRAKETMIATNDTAYQSSGWDTWRQQIAKIRDYTPEEIQKIIQTGSLAEQQKLSRNYFYKDGYYKHIIIHYATLLKYAGLLIPNPANGKSLSTPHIQKRYYTALDYVENMSLSTFFANCAQRALVDGSYFGAKLQIDNKHFSVIDLPCGYCCSRFKDEAGNDLVEFDVRYFETIKDPDARKAALATYPKIISKAFKEWINGKRKKNSSWVILPSDIGICFPFFDGRPLFLSVIPKTIEYDDAVSTEIEKEINEIKKIIVQKMPHLTDGRLVFEPEEAQEMHAAAVGMVKSDKNINVLTTYADVEAITSKTSNDNANTIMQRMEQNIYAQAGVSGQVFAPTGSGSLDKSLQNDLALMMYLADKLSRFMTNIINDLFGNSNITFKYNILPVSYYNSEKYIDTSFKLLGSGYSALIPAVALGITQRDLVNIKDLENDVLKLRDKLIPLQTAYTQSNDEVIVEKNESASADLTEETEGGRPAKETTEKAETTIVSDESRENTGEGVNNS